MFQNVYSRVGRVCKNDNGGPRTFRNKWTTFLKSRLNCSLPGDYPFYFDQVQAMSPVVRAGQDDLVFGIFNTPENSITGSAVCSFRMKDIEDSFDGAFKGQHDTNSNWLPLAKHDLPAKRPGTCINDSKTLDDEHLNFLKENTLMDQAVTSSINQPHFIKTSPHERLTSLAVDPAVPTASGEKVDVLFVGTTRGRILKLALQRPGPHTGPHRHNTVLIEQLQVFPLHVAVSHIQVVATEGGPRVVAVSDHEVKSLPVSRCGRAALQSCGACVGLQDPYCAWNIQQQQCGAHAGSSQDSSELLQNIDRGVHTGCGPATLYQGK